MMASPSFCDIMKQKSQVIPMKKIKNILIVVMIAVLSSGSIGFMIKQDIKKEHEALTIVAKEDAKKASELATEIVKGGEHSLLLSSIQYPQRKDQYATISVDRVGFEKPLYYGDSTDILDKGIGQFAGSGIPGEGRPTLVAGHNGTHFYQLRNMKKDDIVSIKTTYGDYQYQIYDMKIMHKNEFDTSQLQDKEEYLIMYCCYPFNSLDTDDRYFVYAKFLTGNKLKGGS